MQQQPAPSSRLALLLRSAPAHAHIYAIPAAAAPSSRLARPPARSAPHAHAYARPARPSLTRLGPPALRPAPPRPAAAPASRASPHPCPARGTSYGIAVVSRCVRFRISCVNCRQWAGAQQVSTTRASASRFAPDWARNTTASWRSLAAATCGGISADRSQAPDRRHHLAYSSAGSQAEGAELRLHRWPLRRARVCRGMEHSTPRKRTREHESDPPVQSPHQQRRLPLPVRRVHVRPGLEQRPEAGDGPGAGRSVECRGAATDTDTGEKRREMTRS